MCAVIFFLASFFTLRIVIVKQFQIALDHVYRSGLLTGFLHDLAFCFIPLALYFLFRSLSQRLARSVEIFSWIVLYLMALSNACYQLFFRRPLDPQMLRYGTGNLWELRGILFHFMSYAWIDASVILFILAIFLRLRATKVNRVPVLTAFLFLLLFQCTKQVPIWFKIPRMEESPLAQSVPLRWFKQFKTAQRETASPDSVQSASLSLLQFKQMKGDSFPNTPFSLTANRESNFSTDPARTRALRAQFGLPEGKTPNVILVFLESNRAFEFLDPEIGSVVYPHLHQVFKEHGILFSQTYSSANYTVEGQFATLCSSFDRMDGPPVYASSPYLQIRCLPELMTEAGYETYWFNPFDRNFSGKFLFESHHGMKEFFDQDFFATKEHATNQNQTEWGVSDHDFFLKSLAKLEELSKKPNPFFAHLLNIGTHAPWHHYAGHDLPLTFSDQFKGESNHQAYLSSVLAEDAALGEFFEAFFKSPLAQNTVVIISSDHGNGVIPAYPKLASHQQRLLWPRIIFGAVSAGIKKPIEIHYPVHQVDIAPLIGSLTGLTGKQAWLGRDPMLGSGTPWIRRNGKLLSYRTANRFCYESASQNRIRCFAAGRETDPLLESSLESVPEDPRLSQSLRRVIQADEELIDSGSF